MEEKIKEMLGHFAKAPEDTLEGMTCPSFVQCDETEQTLVLSFDVSERVKNPNGTLHGGWIATALDTAMGILANYFGEGRRTQTVSFQVSYLRPGSLEGSVKICVNLTKRGKTMQYVNGEAWREDGKSIATATGVYYTVGEGPKLG